MEPPRARRPLRCGEPEVHFYDASDGVCLDLAAAVLRDRERGCRGTTSSAASFGEPAAKSGWAEELGAAA